MHWLADVDAVFFDAVGTLIHPEPSVAVAYARVGQRHGSTLSAEVIRQRFATAFAREEVADRAAGWRTDEARELRRWQDLVAVVLDDVAEQAACFAELYAHFAQPTSWRVEAEAGEVLSALAARGLIVGMASNFDRRLRSVVAGLPELTAVRHFAISSELGWRKPAAEFFAALAQAAGVPAARILVVGDDFHNDYEGTRAAGLRPLLFDPHGKAAAEVRRIARLSEVFGGEVV